MDEVNPAGEEDFDGADCNDTREGHSSGLKYKGCSKQEMAEWHAAQEVDELGSTQKERRVL